MLDAPSSVPLVAAPAPARIWHQTQSLSPTSQDVRYRAGDDPVKEMAASWFRGNDPRLERWGLGRDLRAGRGTECFWSWFFSVILPGLVLLLLVQPIESWCPSLHSPRVTLFAQWLRRGFRMPLVQLRSLPGFTILPCLKPCPTSIQWPVRWTA